MQNKGFVRVFAIALALVCLFYLSFSFVTSHYNKKAQEYAQGDSNKQFKYLDSIAGEQVWLGYTLKECREKEINLGLDLKGGMNVILEVSVSDILKVLSGYNTSEIFTEALKNTQLRQTKSGSNFLKIFQEEFEKIDPNARLSAIFSTVELKDKIQLSSTNDEVIKVLQEEVDGAISNSFNVLRSRIDRFGVVQPNIQKLEVEGRILVELPGIKEPERVRKLLQGSANLEFWETYEASELMPMLRQANTIIRELNQVEEAAEEVKEETVTATIETAATDSLTLNKDSLLASLKDKKTSEDQEKALAEFKKNNPDSAKELLKGFTDEEIKNVIHCIKAHYCLKGDKPETIEAKIVQDCDTLDMLGAIGIARGFMAGGEKGLGLAEAKDEYKNKRLGLYDKLNLEESRRIADEKFKFTQLFFETIDREMA